MNMEKDGYRLLRYGAMLARISATKCETILLLLPATKGVSSIDCKLVLFRMPTQKSKTCKKRTEEYLISPAVSDRNQTQDRELS